MAALVAQPKDAIILHRLNVSKSCWCRSCGGGAKMGPANWIVTSALLCHTELPLHWLPSRPLITRMNGINLTIQWSSNGRFSLHTCWWAVGWEELKGSQTEGAQLTRWPVWSCITSSAKKLQLFFLSGFLCLKLSLWIPSQGIPDSPQVNTSAHTGKDKVITYYTVPVHRVSIHVERCGNLVEIVFPDCFSQCKAPSFPKAQSITSTWFTSGPYHLQMLSDDSPIECTSEYKELCRSLM